MGQRYLICGSTDNTLFLNIKFEFIPTINLYIIVVL